MRSDFPTKRSLELLPAAPAHKRKDVASWVRRRNVSVICVANHLGIYIRVMNGGFLVAVLQFGFTYGNPVNAKDSAAF